MSEVAASSFKVATLNVEGGLSDPNALGGLVDGIARVDADIFVLPNALDASGRVVDPDFAGDMGYDFKKVSYQDCEPHVRTEQYIGMLVRREIGADVSQIRLAHRNALRARVSLDGVGAPVDVFGVAFDEQLPHERLPRLRRAMGEALLRTMRADVPTVVAGDFEGMHPDSFQAWLLTRAAVRYVCPRVPLLHNTRYSALEKLSWARGDAIRSIEAADLTDADIHYRATLYSGRRPVAQLDHILYSAKLLEAEFGRYGRIVPGNRRIIAADISARTDIKRQEAGLPA